MWKNFFFNKTIYFEEPNDIEADNIQSGGNRFKNLKDSLSGFSSQIKNNPNKSAKFNVNNDIQKEDPDNKFVDENSVKSFEEKGDFFENGGQVNDNTQSTIGANGPISTEAADVAKGNKVDSVPDNSEVTNNLFKEPIQQKEQMPMTNPLFNAPDQPQQQSQQQQQQSQQQQQQEPQVIQPEPTGKFVDLAKEKGVYDVLRANNIDFNNLSASAIKKMMINYHPDKYQNATPEEIKKFTDIQTNLQGFLDGFNVAAEVKKENPRADELRKAALDLNIADVLNRYKIDPTNIDFEKLNDVIDGIDQRLLNSMNKNVSLDDIRANLIKFRDNAQGVNQNQSTPKSAVTGVENTLAIEPNPNKPLAIEPNPNKNNPSISNQKQSQSKWENWDSYQGTKGNDIQKTLIKGGALAVNRPDKNNEIDLDNPKWRKAHYGEKPIAHGHISTSPLTTKPNDRGDFQAKQDGEKVDILVGPNTDMAVKFHKVHDAVKDKSGVSVTKVEFDRDGLKGQYVEQTTKGKNVEVKIEGEDMKFNLDAAGRTFTRPGGFKEKPYISMEDGKAVIHCKDQKDLDTIIKVYKDFTINGESIKDIAARGADMKDPNVKSMNSKTQVPQSSVTGLTDAEKIERADRLAEKIKQDTGVGPPDNHKAANATLDVSKTIDPKVAATAQDVVQSSSVGQSVAPPSPKVEIDSSQGKGSGIGA